MNRKPRVLIGKVGLDGHDVGARVVARALADSGIEVVYTGLRQTPEQIVRAAVQEDVDLIGVSILSGSHMTFLPEIARRLVSYGANDIGFIAGGIIPAEDMAALKEIGVAEIFPPETRLDDIVAYVRKSIDERSRERGSAGTKDTRMQGA
jgi:methylmalonyl-CoA mutase C-terminal domain/subunit